MNKVTQNMQISWLSCQTKQKCFCEVLLNQKSYTHLSIAITRPVGRHNFNFRLAHILPVVVDHFPVFRNFSLFRIGIFVWRAGKVCLPEIGYIRKYGINGWAFQVMLVPEKENNCTRKGGCEIQCLIKLKNVIGVNTKKIDQLNLLYHLTGSVTKEFAKNSAVFLLNQATEARFTVSLARSLKSLKLCSSPQNPRQPLEGKINS